MKDIFSKHSKKVLTFVVLIQLAVIYSLVTFDSANDIHNINLDSENIQQTDETYLDINHFYRINKDYSKGWNEAPGYNVTFKTIINENGLRNKENYSYTKPEDTFRIGFFGDSFTYGYGVNQSDRWTNLLEDRLNNDLDCKNNFQGINFGVSGYDTQYSVEMFLQEGQKYDNDLNIFYFTDNDVNFIDDLYREKEEKYLQKALAEEGKEDISELSEETHRTAIETASEEYQDKRNSMSSLELREKQISEPLEALAAEIENPESIVIFTSHISEENNQHFREVSQDLGFEFITLDKLGPHYNEKWDHFSYLEEVPDSHSNPEGHKFLSDFVFLDLMSNNMVECS